MKKVPFAFILTGLITIVACNQKPNVAGTNLVQNAATADTTQSQPATNESMAVIEFEKTLHDFGTITQGEQAEYSFKFRNSGGTDLLITGAQASCGCTVPEYPKNPIKPGEQGFIKVKFNSDYRLDAFEKSVVVIANTQPTETSIRIKGFIKPNPNNAGVTNPF